MQLLASEVAGVTMVSCDKADERCKTKTRAISNMRCLYFSLEKTEQDELQGSRGGEIPAVGKEIEYCHWET